MIKIITKSEIFLSETHTQTMFTWCESDYENESQSENGMWYTNTLTESEEWGDSDSESDSDSDSDNAGKRGDSDTAGKRGDSDNAKRVWLRTWSTRTRPISCRTRPIIGTRGFGNWGSGLMMRSWSANRQKADWKWQIDLKMVEVMLIVISQKKRQSQD